MIIAPKNGPSNYPKLYLSGELPDRIIFYRDGVSDGQLRTVMEHEVVQIQAAFSQISPEYNPKFAFIVVKKRINHRFFMPGWLEPFRP